MLQDDCYRCGNRFAVGAYEEPGREMFNWLKQSETGAFAAIILAATIWMSPAFIAGHIVGHSSYLNVNWAEGFARQLASGEIYPRWLPDMNAGAGISSWRAGGLCVYSACES